jgi:uncharacterized protein (TIGR02453 family)
MRSSINLKPVIGFLSGLRENNNKAWFDKNRAAYEQAREAFEDLIEQLISELGAFENLQGVSARDCIFRINRDVRFSKDKSPYKTSVGAAIAPGGKKSKELGYYIHIQPQSQSLLAGGLYMPTSDQLAKFRQAIDRDARPFKKITKDVDFVRYFGALEGERLTTAPQGYNRDHPEIELLRLKQVTVVHHLTDKQVLSPDFPAHAVQVFRSMKPFSDYLNRALH